MSCAPTTLASITQAKFEKVRKLMKRCVDHMVGEAPASPAAFGQLACTCVHCVLVYMCVKNKLSYFVGSQRSFQL